MEILQGRYLKKNDAESPQSAQSGKPKVLTIKTTDGVRLVQLPKELRAIAQQELSPGDLIRVWVEPAGKKSKKAKKSEAKKDSAKKDSIETFQALQLIPLSPKTNVTLPVSMAKTKAEKKKGSKQMRVQLCQKKNCCKRGGTKLWESFNQVANNPTSELPSFKLESVGCIGGCKRGPNLRFLPDNVKHYSVQPKDVERLLLRHQS